MQDPARENITGHQERRHTFNHNIEWHYMALAVLGIVVVWMVKSYFESESVDELGADAAEIEIEERGQSSKWGGLVDGGD